MDDLSLLPKPGKLIPEEEEEQVPRDLIPQKRQPGGFGSFLAQKYGGAQGAAGTGNGASSFGGYLAGKYGGAPAQTAQPVKPPKDLGFVGTVKEGARGTLRNIGATVDTAQGDAPAVVAASKEAAAAPKDPALAAILTDIDARKKALGEDPGWLESIGTVGHAALRNPKGAALLIAEQAPNSAAALAAGYTGMKVGAGVGSLAGPLGAAAGAVFGGIAGMFGANTVLETGGKAIEAASDGAFTPEEQSRVLKEGAIKGGVITGVDALTLGMTNFIMGTTARAVERATIKTLTDNGVDVTSKAAREAALKNPVLMESVHAAQKRAQEASNKLGKKIARTGGAVGLETVGEGAGEYLGEYAATGKADKVDAIIEAFSSLGQSAGEVAFTAALNKKALSRIFSSQKDAEKAAATETKATGVEHVVQPHPDQPDKFVAVPKTRSATGVSLERDAAGNLTPTQPASTQADFNLANKPGFLHTAEDKIRQREMDQQRADAYAANPIVTPTIAGKPVTGLSNKILIDTAIRGGERAKAAAAAELARRKAQGVDPAIANAPESNLDAVHRIITTGREKAQEDSGAQVAAIPPGIPDSPSPEPAGTLAAQLKALEEGRKPGVLLTPGEAHPETLPKGVKTADIPGRGTLLYRDDMTLQAALAGRMGEALGYGIEEKPLDATHAVTVRDKDGTVIHDVMTDGRQSVLDAAAVVAGPDGTVEERPIDAALAERDEGTIERYQWMRNKEGGQKYGNYQETRPLNRELFEQHIKKRLRKEFQDFDAYTKAFPEDTHVSLFSTDKGKTWKYDGSGTVEELRPTPENAAWVKKVESFDSPDAIKQGNTADSEIGAPKAPEAAAKPPEKTAPVTPVQKPRFKVDSKISRYHDPISEPLRARVEDALNNAPESYSVSHDGAYIRLPKKNGDNQTGSLKIEDDGRVSMFTDSGFGLASTMSNKSIENTLTEWLRDFVDTKGKKPAPETVNAGDDGIRPLVESLIKRRAAANQMNKGRIFDKVLGHAKALLAGETVLPARFKSAAALLAGDKTTADILNALHEKAVAVKKAAKAETKPPKAETPPVTPVTPVTPPVSPPATASKLKDGIHDRAKISPDYYSGGYPWQIGYDRQKSGSGVSMDGKDILAAQELYTREGMNLRDAIRHAEIAGVVVPDEAYKKLASLKKVGAKSETAKPVAPEKLEQTEAQKKKQADADARKAQATRKKAERDLHVLAVTTPELMNMAGTMDLESYTEGVNAALAKEIPRIANEYGGPEKDAVLALVADGKAVLPREFYAAAYKAAKTAWEEQQKIDARDPQLYRDTLDWGMGARQIDKTGDQAAQYKEGFDHALKGKTKSTLPQGGRHADGYDDARAWIKTEAGKAWFEGKRQAKEKSTGEALKRWWERAKKGLDALTSMDMKKAWAQILKATARAELFPNLLADDATPGAKEWLDKFRGKVATFSEYYVRVMIHSSLGRGRYGATADRVFEGSYGSYRGRGAELEWKDVDVTEEMAAEREKARQAVIAIYDAANKLSPPDAEAAKRQQEVINDESRWQSFASNMAVRDNHAQTTLIFDYFQKIEAKKKDKARLELTKQIATEYQQHMSALAAKFDGLKTMDEIKAVIEGSYGKPGDYLLGTKEADDIALYFDNNREIEEMLPGKPDSWSYKYGLWRRLEETENNERAQKDKKDTLMRPRLDRIERNMPDERKGRSISAAEFKKTFNFADVTIGEYVTAKEAEDHLNYAYDALQSLALMLGAKPSQLSFGGTLHFSIGALGHGKYAAHFQPKHPTASGKTVPVINVTKTRGDGSVLHEYFHAIDFLTTDPALKKAIESVKRLLRETPLSPSALASSIEGFLSGTVTWNRMRRGATPKDHALYALNGPYHAGRPRSVRSTQFLRDARELDKGAGDNPYWSNQYEPWARAAESWGYDKLLDSKQRDDYLQSGWAADGKVTSKTHRGTPYPQGEERQRLNGLMDELTRAIEWTDEGPRLKADHAWQKELPFDAMMKPYAEAVKDTLANIDQIERDVRAKKEKKRADEAAAREKAERERIFGVEEEKPIDVVPTPSSEPVGDAPMSEDELSSIFDEEANAAREATQDEPEADAPGEALDAQGWTREDIGILINLVEKGRVVLVADSKIGLPTIHDIPSNVVRHMGYGLFEFKAPDYEGTFDAGSAMSHLPGGQSYTEVSLSRGSLPFWNKDQVLSTLRSLAGEPAAAAADQKEAAPKSSRKPEKPLPELSAEQEKTAAILAKDFAKHGVKGLDKTLSGLVKLFGGGPNKLQSFPGGFDEKTYAEAKALFKEAAEEFRKSGMSFKEFVRVFFRSLIAQFGDGVKPYAVRFAQEYQKGYEQVEGKDQGGAKDFADIDPKGDTQPDPKNEEVTAEASPSAVLSDWVLDNLKNGRTMTWQALFAEADRQFGGTQANGVYTPKDAYDAVELAINRYLIEEKIADPALMQKTGIAKIGMDRLEKLLELVPTQTKRTAEMDEFQQFSTPPHFSFLANWVANLKANDVYLEPSAGVGGLAAYAKVAGVRQVIVNELSARRLALLRNLPFDRYFSENAEQLNNILPDDVKPTVIVMNPPFSSTAGRMQGKRDTMNGALHIEQALKRLNDGGRLVAIVGEGMAADRPAFREWWNKIEKEYNVRANIGISGASYAKYGTTFDNQILVIDKSGATTAKVITGKVENPADALKLLEEVRNDRPKAQATTENGDVASGTGRPQDAEDSGRGTDTGTDSGTGAPGAAVVGGGGQRGGSGSGGSRTGKPDGNRSDQSDGSGKDADKSGRRGSDSDTAEPVGRGNETGNSASDTGAGKPDNNTGLRLDSAANAEAGGITNSVFEPYTPKKVRIEGAVPHNTPLVESAAMAAVSPPDPTYTPNLPKSVITKGLLSDAQLEAVVYAGQAHAQMLRDGETRRGFFLGDGTGVGKGRQISGIIMDNMRQGRKKAVWISKKKELIEDAKRDFSDLGGDPKQIFAQAKHKTTDKIAAKEGILFSAYPTMRSQSKLARAAQKAAGKQRKADDAGISFERVRQMVNWLGKDFDGVIVFDESHEMGSAVAVKGKRGNTEPSEQALAGIELQKALPKARIVYVSATGATEVQNLGYAPRLGLWGEGTPFTDVTAFINAMSQSVSAMELVAQNLKQMGLYLARSLSYDGVTYEQLLHELSSYQRETYDLLVQGWQTVLNNMEAALKTTGAAGGGKDTGKIKSGILSRFWGTHQRFFNQIITASQMPSILDQIEKDLKEGRAVVLQLTNTDEAGQQRAIAKAAGQELAEGDVVEELDLTPREQLISLIENAFPVLQYEAYTDADNVKHLRPVLDSKGVQVMNKEAVAARAELIKNIRTIRIPDSPMQMLVDHFGVDKIAEITGRTQRVIRDENGKFKVEKRGPAAVAADSQAFKDGKKNILVFSAAGGTGFSFHSDRRYKNRKKRAHYIMQAGWSADKAVQGFGRSHRTNQENEPVYRLVKTDIPAHKRFISSIARRLEQLGALTAGQRDTAGSSIFSAADNLESSYSAAAVRQFFETVIQRGQTYNDLPADLLEQMGLTGIVDPKTGGLNDSKIPPITQFLNRLLSLRLDTQSQVFDLFMQELEKQIEVARRLGTFDDGLATIKHVGADVVQEKEVYRDPSTNADVRYIEIKYRTPNAIYDFSRGTDALKGARKGAGWFKNKTSGRVAAIWETSQTVTHKDGSIDPLYGVWRTGGQSYDSGKTLKMGNFERITEAQAQELWEQENAVRPKEREHDLHMVVGGILPLWDRFKADHVQVVRVAVDDGRRFLGRQIAGKDLAETLKRLDVQSSTAKMTGREIAKAVLDGKSVELTNAWTLKRVRVSNENRIEIDLGGKYLSMMEQRRVQDAGGIYERIGWEGRYFIPADLDRGGRAIDALLQKFGANAVTVNDPDAPAPAFSRSTSASSAVLPKPQVQSIVDAIRARWKNAPEVVLLDSIADASQAVRAENERQLSMGATGEPEGFVHNGKVYIVASQMKSAGDVTRVLLHEALGHFGLRGLYGAGLNKILKQIAALRPTDVKAKAKQYGLDMKVEKDRLIAAEEVLAELSQTNPKINFVRRAIAAIRTWLRENIPDFETLALSDDEIIRNYLIPAREFVQQGRTTAASGGLAGAFSRKEVADFSTAVDDVLDGKSSAAIRIGNTPLALRQATMPKRSLWVTKRVIDKLYREHGLSRQQIKSLPELLAKPIMVLDSPVEPGIFVVLTSETHKSQPVTVYIKPNGEIKRIGPANVVTSAYERPSTDIMTWMLGEKLIASDHEKALAWITTQGLKLPLRTPEVTVAPASDRTGRGGSTLQQLEEAVRKSLPINVPKDNDNVNLSRSAPQIDTPAFKKWFGNSKVVDAEGKPLVVYRGQHGENDGLQSRHGSISFGDKGTANLYATQPNERKLDSEALAAKVIPAYLSIQNPIINTPDDPFIETGTIRAALGEKEAKRIALKFADQIEYTGNWQDDDGYGATYDTVAEMLGKDPDALGKLYFQAFPYLDDAVEVAKLKAAGFDGAIHAGMGENSDEAEYKVFSENQVKSAIGNSGAFDGSNPDIRFSRSAAPTGASSSTPATPATFATPAAPPIRDRMDKVVDSLIYNFQDRFKPLKDIQKRAGDVPEDQDAALAEERYSGMVRARTDDFEAEMRDPLIKAIHDSGVSYDDVEEFLHARHAPSRNAAMREINPTAPELEKQTADLTALRESLAKDADVEEYVKTRRELRLAEADIEDGIADESLGRMLNADLAKLRKLPAVKDYLNAVEKLRALRGIKPFEGDNTSLSGMSNAEAQAILVKSKENGTEAALLRISALVDAITSRTREIFVESGLETAETIEAWNKKYEHYVPLHRDEVGGTGNPPIGKGFNIRGRESKRATGSNREVTDILAHVVAQHEAAIIRSEKTKVDRALFALAQANPDPALWTLDTADMIRTVDPISGLAVNRVDPLYRDRPNVLSLKIDGEEHTITFTKTNQEGMRLAASMKNLGSQELGEVTRVVGQFTRFLATMNTTANPVFITRNFLRDLQTSFVNLSDTELAGMKKQVFMDVPAAIKGMWNMARGDKSSEWAKYAHEFRNAGGQTGWMEHYKDIGARADKLRQQLEVMGPGKLNFTKRTAQAWWDVISDANNAVENGVRLAAYVNARKAGLSEGKAASLAKNLTVNFNAHGAKGVELNMWYMFMNASIQGTARLIKALSNQDVQRIVGGIVASGLILDILARSMAGDDDDDGENDYDQLPEHTKAMNFVFMVDNRPVTIPMPYGYNFFASLGRKISEVMFRENYSAVKSGVDLASVFLDAFSPVGQAGSLLQYAAPTVADPFIQWAENKNFAGNPLRREQHPFGVPNPEYQMGFKSTSAPAKWLAETLNETTGGNEARPGFVNVNPALFDFAVSSIAGGAGRSYLQAASLPIKAARDEDIQAREVPFANIFFSAKPEYQVERKYFDAVKKVELAKEELKTYRGNAEMIAQIRADHGNELKLTGLAIYTKAVLTNLRKQEMLLAKSDKPNKAELRKALEDRKRAAMARFNQRYRAAVSD